MKIAIQRKISSFNYSSRNGHSVKYIVLHYTGNKGDSAKNNVDYFYGGNRGASAHYFVDDNSIWQSVEECNSAWSVGDGKGVYGITNRNSISIEMCCNSIGVITEKTENNALELVKYLMTKYNISISNIVRHYDASRKICPNWSANNWARWINFKSKINGNVSINKSINQPNKPLIDDWVKRLQIACNAQGFSNQIIDGIAGPNTLNGCPTLRKGATGNITKILQEKLVSLGYNTNGVDGIFGSGTENAIRLYQKSNGLIVDGIVGKNTWRKILNI